MRIRRILYYFLFLTIIAGAFASMAQNNYGLKIISWSCYLFSLTFLIELYFNYGKMSFLRRIEQLILTAFIALFGLRADYIHFQYVEWVVVFCAVILTAIYLSILINSYNKIKLGNKLLSNVILLHYFVVVAFLLSVALRPLNSLVSQVIGGIGGLCLGIVVLSVVFRNKQILDGQEVKILRYIRDRDDHSSWFVTGFLMISMYVSLNFLGILPTLYTDEVPQAYIELVNEAETGKAEAVNGRYPHDLYKVELDKLLERHKTED